MRKLTRCPSIVVAIRGIPLSNLNGTRAARFNDARSLAELAISTRPFSRSQKTALSRSASLPKMPAICAPCGASDAERSETVERRFRITTDPIVKVGRTVCRTPIVPAVPSTLSEPVAVSANDRATLASRADRLAPVSIRNQYGPEPASSPVINPTELTIVDFVVAGLSCPALALEKHSKRQANRLLSGLTFMPSGLPHFVQATPVCYDLTRSVVQRRPMACPAISA